MLRPPGFPPPPPLSTLQSKPYLFKPQCKKTPPNPASNEKLTQLDALYGKDEQSIMKALFNAIDFRRRGVISKEDFLKGIKYDQKARYWLQKTFLWSLYKSRRWSLLVAMFEPDPSTVLSFPEFYKSCKVCQVDEHVQPCHVRLKYKERSHPLDSKLNNRIRIFEVRRRLVRDSERT